VEGDRRRLRKAFEVTAGRYQQARPDYPEELFDALVELTGVRPGARVLEVGCASGKATLPLARRGFRITAIELGPELAAAARANLRSFSKVEVVTAAFEDWESTGEPYDLVVAATSWHWVDPAVRYEQARSALRPGGHLAFWSAAQVVPDGGDPFFQDLQDVYDEIGEGLEPGAVWLRPGELPEETADIEASGRFEVVGVRHFDWEVVYDADGYLALLDTFSGHLAMEEWQRERLYDEIRRRLAERPDGRLRRHWGAVLHVARCVA
jgi:SAM-dependent methyltransferase